MGFSVPVGFDVDRSVPVAVSCPSETVNGDLLQPELAGLVVEGDEAVGTEAHRVAARRRGVHEEEVVAVGVVPVGEHVVADLLALLDATAPDADRDRGRVLGLGHDAHVDGCLGHAAARPSSTV